MPGLDAARGNALEESSEDALRWNGEPVYGYSGDISALGSLIPFFERQPFRISEGKDTAGDARIRSLHASGENKLWDVIVRRPLLDEDEPTPVGIVSKRYKLVQHQDLFRKASEALKKAGIKTGECEAELMLSAYGTRMALIFALPENFSFDPGDRMPLALRFYGVNSVDGSSRLTIMLGWFRFICGNGLVLGTAQLRQKFVHNEYLELPDLSEVLTQGISLAEKEKVILHEWINKEVTPIATLTAEVFVAWACMATVAFVACPQAVQNASRSLTSFPHLRQNIALSYYSAVLLAVGSKVSPEIPSR